MRKRIAPRGAQASVTRAERRLGRRTHKQSQAHTEHPDNLSTKIGPGSPPNRYRLRCIRQPKNKQKWGFRAKLESPRTDYFAQQNYQFEARKRTSMLEPPCVLLVVPTDPWKHQSHPWLQRGVLFLAPTASWQFRRQQAGSLVAVRQRWRRPPLFCRAYGDTVRRYRNAHSIQHAVQGGPGG